MKSRKRKEAKRDLNRIKIRAQVMVGVVENFSDEFWGAVLPKRMRKEMDEMCKTMRKLYEGMEKPFDNLGKVYGTTDCGCKGRSR